DFAPLLGVSNPTRYAWQRKCEADGPAGLLDKPRGGPAGSRLPEPTRRAILMLKEANPDWGTDAAGLARSCLGRGGCCYRASSTSRASSAPDGRRTTLRSPCLEAVEVDRGPRHRQGHDSRHAQEGPQRPQGSVPGGEEAPGLPSAP